MANEPTPDRVVSRILLVEDNPIDARATIKAAREVEIAHLIHHVSDGSEAVAYLRDGGSTRPDLVLLDLNLPGIDGLDVLDTIKTDPDLRRIPVVVLTTSDNEADVRGAYDRGANAYVTKPVGLDGWLGVVEQIDGFWLSLVTVPEA